MSKRKTTRTDAGAANKQKSTIPVTLPDGSNAELFSTARLRKKRRKKRRPATPPAEDA